MKMRMHMSQSIFQKPLEKRKCNVLKQRSGYVVTTSLWTLGSSSSEQCATKPAYSRFQMSPTGHDMEPTKRRSLALNPPLDFLQLRRFSQGDEMIAGFQPLCSGR